MGDLMQRVLITGAAGFIGANLMSRLVGSGLEVLGIDNFSTYYDPLIKQHHLKALGIESRVLSVNICQIFELETIYQDFRPHTVIHLAAQGGVRAGQLNPYPYIQTNQLGYLNLLELNNRYLVDDFLYASSSSVYGEGLPTPFQEDMEIPGPKSLYALSKVANELMAKSFPSRENHRRNGLRFFTVYGPWGRPDMAVSRLLSSSLNRKPFVLTANLDLERDFTFVDDVVDVIEALIKGDMVRRPSNTILNVAGQSPRSMKELFQICEFLGYPLDITIGEINTQDVFTTHGSVERLIEYQLPIPKTSLEDGIAKTASWMTQSSNSNILSLL